jgi:Zn-dependent protease
MGPAFVVPLRGVPFAVRFTALGVAALVVVGAATTLPGKRVDGVVAGALATVLLLTALVLHEFVRSSMMRAQGIVVWRIDLAVFGGIPRADLRSGRPRSELTAGVVGLLLIALLIAIAAAAERNQAAGLPHDAAWLTFIGLTSFGAVQTLPAPPLDGGRLFRCLVWTLTGDPISAARASAAYGQIMALSLVATGGVLFFRGGAAPYWGIGAAVAGLELSAACFAAWRDALAQRAIATVHLRDLGLPPVRRISAAASVEDVVDALIDEGEGARLLVTAEEGRIVGTIALPDIRQVRRAKWAEHSAHDVMSPLAAVPQLPDDLSAADALVELERMDVPWALAMVEGRPMLLHRDRLTAQIARRAIEAERERRTSRRP